MEPTVISNSFPAKYSMTELRQARLALWHLKGQKLKVEPNVISNSFPAVYSMTELRQAKLALWQLKGRKHKVEPHSISNSFPAAHSMIEHWLAVGAVAVEGREAALEQHAMSNDFLVFSLSELAGTLALWQLKGQERKLEAKQ